MNILQFQKIKIIYAQYVVKESQPQIITKTKKKLCVRNAIWKHELIVTAKLTGSI